MPTNHPLGFLRVVATGAMVGDFMLPFKGQRTWKWENTWLVFTLVALVAIPLAAAFAMSPNLLSIYAACSARDLLPSPLFGFG